ncbi:MAG: hypothetical protein ACK5UJ_03085, partial [Pseudobdellovibrionaceae bacterium]
ASYEEKNQQLDNVRSYQQGHSKEALGQLQRLQMAVLRGENVFEALLEAARVCSLAQMSQALYEVGGQYRRNL